MEGMVGRHQKEEQRMIYTTDGTPVGEALHMACLAVAERRLHKRPRNYALTPEGHRHYRVMKDRLGDPYRVYREVWRHQPGRGYAERQAKKPCLSG